MTADHSFLSPLRRLLPAALVLLAALLCAPPASAMFNRVKPGEAVKLKPGVGLLVVAIDTDVALNTVRLKRVGDLFASVKATDMVFGRNFEMYTLDEGDYYWSELVTDQLYIYKPKQSPEMTFHVAAGRINYAGDLVLRRNGDNYLRFRLVNHSLKVIDWLEQNHATLGGAYPFAYSGYYPDPFPEFYRDQRKATTIAPDQYDRSDDISPLTELPVSVHDLSRPSHIIKVRLSPDGRYLVQSIRAGSQIGIELIDLQSMDVTRLINCDFWVESIDWKSDRELAIGIGPDWSHLLYYFVRINDGADGKATYERRHLATVGRIISLLPDDPAAVLFETRDKHGNAMAHRVDIRTQDSIDHASLKPGDRISPKVDDVRYWLTDPQGHLAMAFAYRDKRPILLSVDGAATQELMHLDEDLAMDPQAISGDRKRLFAIASQDRQQADLVEMDIASRTITRTLFSRPGVDVTGVVLDGKGEPIGVRYFDRGVFTTEYFDAGNNELQLRLARTFPGKTVMVLARDRDSRHVALWVTGTDAPGTTYLLDSTTSEVTELDDAYPWLKGKPLGVTRVVQAKSSDGLAIESYLTALPGGDARPLVVMPHGGPIGVRDSVGYDAFVQFLASQGFAVLQINFRGSAGYGSDFMKAGEKAYGTLIEDDIDAAIRAALAGDGIDANHLCILGASYGGYSALISAIRWPQRFRCAVSLAGVTDRMLFFTASDTGRSKSGREALERLIGDPRTDQATMFETSPLYRYQELKVPILFAHGDEDVRVDAEHMHRMVRMLNFAGHRPIVVEFSDEGHPEFSEQHNGYLWPRIAAFLKQHLVALDSSDALGKGRTTRQVENNERRSADGLVKKN